MAHTHTSADVLGIAYRSMSSAEINRIHSFKEMGMEMLELMRESGDSRELCLAQNRLEEAVFWAVKHVALNGAESH